MRKIRHSELPCIRTYEPYRHLARAVLGFTILETVPTFIVIILNAGVTVQHKTLLNRSMFNIGKDIFCKSRRVIFLSNGSEGLAKGTCVCLIIVINLILCLRYGHRLS